MIFLDFETKSEVDLFKHGAYRYAKHPSTDVLCMCWAIDDGPVQTWVPGDPVPSLPEESLLAAHNSQFDRLIWNHVAVRRYGFPEVPLERWTCTAAQARARGYPGSLENLGKALGLKRQKDKRGGELIRKMSVPPFEFSEKLLAEMAEYCKRDVEVQRACVQAIDPLTDYELAVYHLSEKVNDRGLRVDVDFAREATKYAKAESAEINAMLSELTDGEVTTGRQFAKLKDWVTPRLSAKAAKLLVRYKTDRQTKKTERKETLDKITRFNLLSLIGEQPDQATDPRVAEVLQCADAAGRTSVSKYQAMVDRADPDDQRVRGAYMCFGAGQTGRWSSISLQLHNFSRKCSKKPDVVRKRIMEGKEIVDVLSTLASMLRPSILGPFSCGDWAGIEARVLPWLAQTHPPRHPEEYEADEKIAERLQMFRDGVDVYVETAKAFDGSRFEGKISELSMGYGGGVGAFQAMARNFGVKIDDARANEIKTQWRETNFWAPMLWQRIGNAMWKAVHREGEWQQAGRLWYGKVPGSGPLVCRLPSGRMLYYPEIGIEDDKWGNPVLTAIKGSWKPKADEKKWPRFDLYGGLLSENGTQAAAADVLMDCMLRIEARAPGMIEGHTHDEVICREGALDVLKEEMMRLPSWAEGLPLDAEFWTGPRYRK